MIVLFVLGDLFQVVFIRDHYNGIGSFGGRHCPWFLLAHFVLCFVHLELGQSHLWHELLAQLHRLAIWV